MFDFILWIICPVTLIMCIKLFRRLNEIETKINLLDPSLGKPKSISTEFSPLPTSPTPKKTPPQSVSKPITETAGPAAKRTTPKPKPILSQAVTQAAPTVTSKPDYIFIPEAPAKTVTDVSSPKPLTPKPVSRIPLSDNAPESPQVSAVFEDSPQEVSIEQVIGTRWIPIAGILLLICGAAFFLKYAYDNFTISETARTLIVAVAGFAALIVGEITRRRQYEIVAKSVTAMGFALLYVAVFAANAFYGFLEIKAALTIAIAITAAAMLYAVILDEIVIAFLSLLGGYLTPIIITSDQNPAVPLFAYLLVLSVGTIQCAYYRKWRPVNLLAFIGTFALYTNWFFQYYVNDTAKQMPIALTALTAFFAVFLVMPILYELIKKTKAEKEDVLLVLANSAVTYYFLYTILNPSHRMALAFATLALSVVHLAMTAIAKLRSKEDSDLHIVLLAISLVALTVSLPLFFEASALSFAWAAQGVALAFIGIRYRSLMVRMFGLAALALSCVSLLWWLPMHSAEFRFIFNPAFGVWLAVAAAAYVNHLVYRHASQDEDDLYSQISQALYVLMGVLLIAASIMEWYFHGRYNLGDSSEYILLALPVIFAAALTLFVVRPLCPAGEIREKFAILIGLAGTLCTVVSIVMLHEKSFTFIANKQFLLTALFPIALILCHVLYRFVYTEASGIDEDKFKLIPQITYVLTALLFIAIFIAEWYSHCKYNLLDTSPYIVVKALPVIFAAALTLFVVRPVCPTGKIRENFAGLIAAAGIVITFISLIWLHAGPFTIIANKQFLSVLLFPLTLALCYILYRFVYTDSPETDDNEDGLITQVIYVIMTLLFVAISIAEWYFHCGYNLKDTSPYMVVKALPVIFAAALTLFVVRPVCPTGKIRENFAGLIAAAGIVITFISLIWLHAGPFTIIANKQFLSVLLFPLTLALCYILYRFVYADSPETDDNEDGLITQVIYVIMTLLFVAISIAEWYFHCGYNLKNTSPYMIVKALPPILAAAVVMCYVRPLCPPGKIRETFAGLISTSGIILTVISLAWLHSRSFMIIANTQLLSVMIFPAVLILCHVLYRFVYDDVSESEQNTTRKFYAFAGLIVMLIATAEWYFHCYFGDGGLLPDAIIGQVVIFAVAIPFFIARPLSPMGKTTRSISVSLTLFASVFTVIATIFFYESDFRIFLNTPFIVGMVFAASLAVSSKLLYMEDSSGNNYQYLASFFGLTFVVVLWLLLTEQVYMYWYCKNTYLLKTENWTYQAYMYISIMWALYAAALMVVGFSRRIPTLRYVALGLFALLLAKIFIVDTSQLENVYRIAAFIATGGILVGIAYLYQYLKKKNFFENLTVSAIMPEEE